MASQHQDWKTHLTLQHDITNIEEQNQSCLWQSIPYISHCFAMPYILYRVSAAYPRDIASPSTDYTVTVSQTHQCLNAPMQTHVFRDGRQC